MLALANMSEAEGAAARLTALIQELCEISEQQLSWVEQQHDEDRFLEGFTDLSNQWTKLQSAVQEEFARCQQVLASEKWKEVLGDTVTPLMARAQENMTRAIRAVEQKLQATGKVLRTANELRQASKAYQSAGWDDHEAYFFDEKK